MKKCEFCNKDHEYYWVIKGVKHLMCEDHYKAMEEQAKRNDLVRNIVNVVKNNVI